VYARERDDIMIIKAGSGFYFHAPRIYYVSFSRYVCACTCSSQTTNAAALNANEFPGRSALEHTRSRCTQCELLHNRIFCCRKLCAEIEPNLALNVSLHCQSAERFCIKLLLQFLLQSRYFKVSGAKGELAYALLFAFTEDLEWKNEDEDCD
jgi:hypothetical protein